MAALLAGCVSDGVGTDLATVSLSSRTQAQDAYVAEICRQAGGGAASVCDVVNWTTFVQAGMNDIDQRCDEYLAWLDQRKRATNPTLLQIAATQDATRTILRASGVGAPSIDIVAAAFGLARETFTNVNARLLIELDHSTVQMVVLRSQTRFRADVARLGVIPNRPQAIYALRQYLRICMPFTIVNEINTTVTTFEAAGANALALKDERPTVSAVAIAAEPIRPREVVRERVTIVKEPVDELAGYFEFFEKPRKYSRAAAIAALKWICVDLADKPTPAQQAAAHLKIKIFQQSLPQQPGSSALTGVLTNPQVDKISSFKKCDSSKHKNAFEADRFPAGLDKDEGLAKDLRAYLGETGSLPDAANQSDIRRIIPAVRSKAAGQLILVDPLLADQITPDLSNAIPEQL